MLQEIIQQNFAGIITTLFLILFIITSSNFDNRINKLFLSAAIFILVLIFVEILEEQCALATKPSMLRVILSAIGYSIRPLIIYTILLIIFRETDKKILIPLHLLLIINILVAFSAIFCDAAFSYDEYNEFVRGPLGFTPFIVSGIYLVLLIVCTMMNLNKNSSKEYMLTFAIAAISIIGTVMESVYKYNSILTSCFAISVTFYYLFYHTNINNHDALTGALVRRRFYLDAARFHEILTAVVSIDLNDLKVLNDKHGHDAGDKALMTLSKTVNKLLPKRSYLYRTGGDEFMILCNKLSTNELMEFIKNIKNAMNETPYSCAIGYAFYNDGLDIDTVCLVADDSMYKDKISMKGPEYAAKYSR